MEKIDCYLDELTERSEVNYDPYEYVYEQEPCEDEEEIINFDWEA